MWLTCQNFHKFLSKLSLFQLLSREKWHRSGILSGAKTPSLDGGMVRSTAQA
jgi:hypothetical protein